MTANIYIIEDIQEISDLTTMYLEKEGMSVSKFLNAEDALAELENNSKLPDLIILDLNLPGMSGFDFLKKFREEKSKTVPVVIVSARDADEDIIEGLGIGADEFVTKPFSQRVLVARIKAILTRHNETTIAAEETIKFGPYTILLSSCVLKKDSQKIPLSIKEYEILEFLAKNKGQILSPEKIYTGVWKTNYGDFTAVAVYIQRLRKKIEEEPSNPVYIKTINGLGYQFLVN